MRHHRYTSGQGDANDKRGNTRMMNLKIARTGIAGSIAGAAVAAALFSAGSATAQPLTPKDLGIDFGPTATASHYSTVLNEPGPDGFTISTLRPGQQVFLGRCTADNLCQVWGQLDTADNTGWVHGYQLVIDPS